MPYLKSIEKNDILKYGLEKLSIFLERYDDRLFLGALNYIIFKLVKNRMDKYSIYSGKHMGYAELCSLIGTLDCAKEEIRRRILNPYEDEKIKENGDVL